MVQRVTKTGKRPAARRGAEPAGGAATPAADLDARLAAITAERDAALAELAEARRHIAALEAARAQVVDRIDWIVDSLKSVIEAER